MSSAASAIDHSQHSRFSDPGRFSDLVRGLPVEPAEISGLARNVIVHYRASGHDLPLSTRGDVNHRWLEDILAADQSRHDAPLTESRDVVDRVQGCCRDHTLFCVGALREHGIAARSRVGFAGYFLDDWHHDHVIVEAWIGGRWRRFDSEVEAPSAALADPMDIGHCEAGGRGFVTAAQAWAAYRAGGLDPSNYGVDPALPLFSGERFVFDEVIYEIAHRFGDELLLWDGWGRIGEPGVPVSETDAAWLDPIVELLLQADQGDLEAERRLHDHYVSDAGLHPGPVITQASPFGDPMIEVDLVNH